MNSEFLLGSTSTSISIKQQRIFFLCKIRLKDSDRELMPLEKAAKIHGDFLLGFSYVPKLGEFFEYEGFMVQVVASPRQYPYRYKTKGKKRPPELDCVVVDRVSINAE